MDTEIFRLGECISSYTFSERRSVRPVMYASMSARMVKGALWRHVASSPWLPHMPRSSGPSLGQRQEGAAKQKPPASLPLWACSACSCAPAVHPSCEHSSVHMSFTNQSGLGSAQGMFILHQHANSPGKTTAARNSKSSWAQPAHFGIHIEIDIEIVVTSHAGQLARINDASQCCWRSLVVQG